MFSKLAVDLEDNKGNAHAAKPYFLEGFDRVWGIPTGVSWWVSLTSFHTIFVTELVLMMAAEQVDRSYG